MNKPTTQELWEKICKSLDWEYSPDGVWEKLEDKYTRELIQQYAQTYHEEQLFPRMKTCINCNVKEIGHCSDPKCTNFSNQPNQ